MEEDYLRGRNAAQKVSKSDTLAPCNTLLC